MVLASRLDNAQLLYLYARYKQATEGVCHSSRPGLFDPKGRQKWDAWKSLGTMNGQEAKQQYIDAVQRFDPDWQPPSMVGAKGRCETLGVSVSTLRRPEDNIADDEKTPFDWVKENNVERLKACAGQLDVFAADCEGRTLLHWACDRGHTQAARFLLEHKAAINQQDNDGLTPLHYACSCDYMEVVKLLIEFGADASIVDGDGQRSDELASQPIQQLLLSL